MDIQSQTQQTINDDQELAKVLAGVGQQANQAAASTELEDIETPLIAEEPVLSSASLNPVTPVVPAVHASKNADTDLDSIKQDALSELRPLVDKLDVSPEEKFDTYLLLLRSTDDTSLIAPAHESARNIVDEARRAQALLDIIKEIDYLSAGQQAPTV